MLSIPKGEGRGVRNAECGMRNAELEKLNA
jgi:hypothetical protein